ncbi:hypothetical protein OM292_05565 [Escherichia albertii]|nr:hypothetical protein [Escherichia albertii]MCZ8804691.1 hypothetical protein [Escherichia albertii]MCZ9059674.1 hypothetical protein [Escherichia albertii]
MRRVIQSLCCSRTDSPLADSKQHNRKFQRQDFEHFKKDIISVINNNENIYCLRDGNLLGVFIKTCSKSDDNSYKNMMFTLFFDSDVYGNRIIKASPNDDELQLLSAGCSNDNILHFINAFLVQVKFPVIGRVKPELLPKNELSQGISSLRWTTTGLAASQLFQQRQFGKQQQQEGSTEYNTQHPDEHITLAPPVRCVETLHHQRLLPLRSWLNDFLSEITHFPETTKESFFHHCLIIFRVVQKIDVLGCSHLLTDSDQNSEIGLSSLIDYLELISSYSRLTQSPPRAIQQLSEDEWTDFFCWLLNSLACLDYVIINLTPETKKMLMNDHSNNIQEANDALYSQRRCKTTTQDNETFTRRNDAIFGNHVWQTFGQFFPPGVEKPSV